MLPDPAPEASLTTLPNGVRLVHLAQPHLRTSQVSVFLRSGSQHETARENGISHVVEHMAFKGTASRDCQRINLDAESLGAEVNAHTDKDHTAFHMSGLAEHADCFVRMLGDIVRHGSFPADELERERQVILQEFAEDEDDAVSTSFKLFDKTCYGEHPWARPVIGSRRNIERFSRDELLAYVARQYTGANLVVAVGAPCASSGIAEVVEQVFGSMPAGHSNLVEAPTYEGGIHVRRLGGYSQTHVVLGFPIPALTQPHQAAVVAAAVFGEGMSSPLLDQLRERRGLVYHAACTAEVGALNGQFFIEASLAPERLDEFFGEVMRLLQAHARSVSPVDLARAQRQLAVRSLRAQERSVQRLESAVQDLFALGRIRSQAEQLDGLAAVDADQVRACFEQLLASRASVALAGKLGRGAETRAWAAVAAR